MLRGNYKFKSIITFRYTAPTAKDKIPMVFVLASRHRDGMLHGINLRYLTPLQQQQLQYVSKTQEERAKETINPFQQQSQIEQQVAKQKQAQIDEYERKKQEAAQAVQGYVIKPQKGNMFGVSTFTKTNEVVVQKARAAFGKLTQYTPYGGKQAPPAPPQQQQQPPQIQSPYQQQTPPPPPPPQIPPPPVLNIQGDVDNPSEFYYNTIKRMWGQSTRNSYRRYKHNFIENERVLYLKR